MLNRFAQILLMIVVGILSIDLVSRRFYEDSNDIGRYIQNNAPLIMQTLEDFQRKKMQEQKNNAIKMLSDNKNLVKDHDAIIGNKDGSVQIIEFLDFSCGYCKKSLPIKEKLIKEYKNIKFIIKEIPMFGQSSVLYSKASKAAFHASPERYFEFHKRLLLNKMQLDEKSLVEMAKDSGIDADEFKKHLTSNKSLEEYIGENVRLAMELGVEGTPAFIINGELIGGFLDYEGFKAKIESIK